MTAPAEKLISLPSRLDRLGALRQEVFAHARAHGFAPLAAEDLGLCVHEAASNAIVHGNREDPGRPVHIRLAVEPGGIRVTVTNAGPGFDPRESTPDADADQPRGRGLRIIEALAREVAWSDEGRRLSFLNPRG